MYNKTEYISLIRYSAIFNTKNPLSISANYLKHNSTWQNLGGMQKLIFIRLIFKMEVSSMLY